MGTKSKVVASEATNPVQRRCCPTPIREDTTVEREEETIPRRRRTWVERGREAEHAHEPIPRVDFSKFHLLLRSDETVLECRLV
jgi:hypothetical protein